MKENFFPFNSKNKRFSLPDYLLISFLIVISVWIYLKAEKLPGYKWNWELLANFIIIKNSLGHPEPGLLLKGLFTTLRIGFWTIVFSFFTGILIGLFQARASRPAAFICQSLINIIRNIPPLVILFCVYFFAGNLLPVQPLEEAIKRLPLFLPDFFHICVCPSGQLDRMISAVFSLGIYQAMFIAEITRGGMTSVNSGQWDAALALGFSKQQCMRLIILPQAARLIIPPLTGQAITTFKDSALASLISLPDLTFQSLEIMSISRMTFEIWISCALLYLIIGAVCAFFGRMLEKRYSIHPI